ncbi:glucosaminidase domain-containing protein [Winogradskyella sp. 3972H.M.0a.05]|uniref:glucosaminidase domain-containing protein n=1 Tax=Winogradskyella sp. 3972H.M.0a.05 TaxID=2950277 RepID=UPI00339A7949
MNKIKLIITIVCFGLLVVSCKSKKGIVTKKKDTKVEQTTKTTKEEPKVIETKTETPKVVKPANSTTEYIERFSDIAQEEMRRYKIPASITLAQGILESGSGRGRLAREANNHFGIKCHGWKGKKIYHDDDKRQECFRKYKDPKTSYEDHSKFLTSRKRYSNLFKLKKNDYKAWAKGLRAAGYATDRKYPQKLISLIERYELYKYDEAVLGKSEIPSEEIPTEVSHKVIKGDTLYSISKRYGVTIESIQQLNNLSGTAIALGQVLIIKK